MFLGVSTARARRHDEVFHALSDPTRRAILELLRRDERCVNDIAAPFAMSQPAISQHLKVLGEAGLVRARKEGRQSFYRLEAAPLRDAYEWLARYERFWNTKLDALGRYLDEQHKEVKKGNER